MTLQTGGRIKMAAEMIRDIRRHVMIHAPAGSGKTHALVTRTLALLAAGETPEGIVAVTFTDKAALEMRERIVRGLARPDQAGFPGAEEKDRLRSLWMEVRDEPRRLRVSTIHAFCGDVLRRFPIAVGLDPDFSVLDPHDQAYLRARAVEESVSVWRRDRGTEAGERFRETAGAAGGIRALTKMLVEMLAGRKRLGDVIRRWAGDGAIDPDEYAEEYARGMKIAWTRVWLGGGGETLRERLIEFCSVMKGHPTANKEYALETLTARVHADDFGTTDDILSLTLGFLTKKGEPRKAFRIAKKEMKGLDRALYESLHAAIAGLLAPLAGEAMSHPPVETARRAARAWASCLILYVEVERRYDNLKRQHGGIDFDDLEILALGLLTGQAAERARGDAGFHPMDALLALDNRVRHLLIDEFQDTSGLQWEIVKPLVSEWLSGEGSSDTPRTFFAVGDPNQSIYLFRDAEVTLMRSVRRKIEDLPEENRALVPFETNRRSTRAIVAFANQVFPSLLKGDYTTSLGARAEDGSVSIRLVLGKDPGRILEARLAADTLRSAEGLPVFDRDAKDQRAASWGDMAVLLRTRTSLEVYCDAFRTAGVPYVVIGGLGFFDRPEVRDVLNLFALLIDENDDLALAAWLASPGAGLSDLDLFRVASAEGTTLRSRLRRLASADPRLGRVSRALDRWSAWAGRVSMAEILRRVFEETAFRETTAALLGPPARANLAKLHEMVRAVEARGWSAPADVLHRLQTLRVHGGDEAQADIPMEEGDGSEKTRSGAVRIMTVHAAKGLEFPIVVVPMLGKPHPQDKRSVAVEGGFAGIDLPGAAKGDRNPFAWFRARYNEKRLAEEKRLLYVAATRARDHLFLAGSVSVKGETGRTIKWPEGEASWLGLIASAVPIPEAPVPDLADVLEMRFGAASCPEVTFPAAVDPSASRPDTSGREETASARSYPATEGLAPVRPAGPVFVSDGKDLDEDERPSSSAPWEPAGDLAREKGTLVHRALDILARGGEPAWDRWKDRIAAAAPEIDEAGIQNEIGRVREHVERAVSSPGVSWAAGREGLVGSEIDVIVAEKEKALAVRLDRLYLRDGVYHIVDIKTGRADTPEETAAQVEKYRPQMAMYARAVRLLYGPDAAVRTWLLFTSVPKVVEVDERVES